jgi:hypothetical protein
MSGPDVWHPLQVRPVQIMRNKIMLQLVSVDIYKISMFMYKTIIYGLKIKILINNCKQQRKSAD